jgi:hypothetical protein
VIRLGASVAGHNGATDENGNPKAYLLMKKLKNEKELVKKAIAEGMKYGEERGVVEFEPTDSAAEKIEYIYRLLVHDKIIQPIPQDQISQLSMRHKLAIWASKLD